MREDTDGERAAHGLGLAAGKSFPSPFAHVHQPTRKDWLYLLVAGSIWLKLLIADLQAHPERWSFGMPVVKCSEGEPAGGDWFYHSSRAVFTQSKQKFDQLTYSPSRDGGYIYFGPEEKDGWEGMQMRRERVKEIPKMSSPWLE
eukprot:10820334-Karenia_brevis.AAC.1